jgi:hypothetical protein
MPTGRNWLYFIYVNLGFALYIAGTYYLSSVQEIKDNWPLYRCNPMYMPLSDNLNEDFTYCVQNITTSFMGYLLQPLTFITSTLSQLGANFTVQIDNIRAMFNKIRVFIQNIFQSIFGVFLNIIIEFQKIIIGMKDMVGKTIGILVTLMYVLDGSIKTMNSAWKGPSGQLVRALGKCFHPLTKIKLQNGNIVAIKDVNLGDVLQNGSIVYSTMTIDNIERNNLVNNDSPLRKEKLFAIKNKGVNKETILVTGTHLVFDKRRNKFVEVKNYADATLSNISTDYLCCLITSDHKIRIGDELFWDWEDHFIKKNLN